MLKYCLLAISSQISSKELIHSTVDMSNNTESASPNLLKDYILIIPVTKW